MTSAALPLRGRSKFSLSGRRAWLTGLLMALVLFVALVWPTLYRYDHVMLGQYQLLVRTNRLTGDVQQLTRQGWIDGAYYRPF